MLERHVRERANEDRAPVQALGALEPGRITHLVHDFLVDLVERLDVVAGEGDGDQDQVGLAALDVLGDGVAGLGAEPGRGSHLRLPAEAVGVGEIELLHHSVDGGGDFGGVGVAAVDD